RARRLASHCRIRDRDAPCRGSRGDARAVSLLAPVRTAFRAAAEAILPAASTLDESGWANVERIVENALAQRPRKAQRQIILFLRVLNVYPLLRHRRRFVDLARAQREAVLHDL